MGTCRKTHWWRRGAIFWLGWWRLAGVEKVLPNHYSILFVKISTCGQACHIQKNCKYLLQDCNKPFRAIIWSKLCHNRFHGAMGHNLLLNSYLLRTSWTNFFKVPNWTDFLTRLTKFCRIFNDLPKFKSSEYWILIFLILSHCKLYTLCEIVYSARLQFFRAIFVSSRTSWKHLRQGKKAGIRALQLEADEWHR